MYHIFVIIRKVIEPSGDFYTFNAVPIIVQWGFSKDLFLRQFQSQSRFVKRVSGVR